ncbi:hypothetical protein ACJIZ3_010731 [Penstemon smallii]|uniref:Uncharacterized protein n=1 Tax=Penstemon smallii TaxID=265156 RepID=A0ABD3UH52_9LAMI
MVFALGPGKFYGSSLPRPRFYTDVKFNDERVDPPLPVMDPLMNWANEAHWSMGGLSFTRHRLQGRIEGNVEKLRAQLEEEDLKKTQKQAKPVIGGGKDKNRSRINETPSPPPAPVAIKRRRVVGLVDDDVESEDLGEKRLLVRKLGDDFERVAKESGMAVEKGSSDSGDAAVAARTRSKRDDGKREKGKKNLVKGGKKVGTRSSPRLAKSGGVR